MCFKQRAIVQYYFYIIENGLASVVRDANQYLGQIGCCGQDIDEQGIENALASIRITGGSRPLQEIQDKCDADHVVSAHFYHDTYILQLLANAKRRCGWKRLYYNLRCVAPTDGIGKILLFQGVYTAKTASDERDKVLQACRDLACSLDLKAPPLEWCFLDAGYLVQISDSAFMLASPPDVVQRAVDEFVLDTFPRQMMYLWKLNLQKRYYDNLLELLNGEEVRPPSELLSVERTEWERHRDIIPTTERGASEAIAFVTDNEEKIRVIGSKEAQELTDKLRSLRLNYARLAKAVSDTGRMCDTIFVNIKNYLDMVERLRVEEDGGFIAAARRIQEILQETLSHELARHRAVVERTQNVLSALNEEAQEIRDLQAQEEARMQSVQTSLIAAIASLIGVGQVFTNIPTMMQWDTELKVWFLIFVGVGTFALSHVAFNLRRANTWLDYFCSAMASGAGLLTFYLWSSQYPDWATTVQSALPQSSWTKVVFIVLGFIIGPGLTFLLDRLVAWWNRKTRGPT